MALSRKRKVLAVLLGLAAMVLVADRLTPGPGQAGPAQVKAAVTPGKGVRPTEVPVTNAADEVTGDASGLADDSLAARLETFCREHDLDPLAVRDAFCAPQSWLADLQPEQPMSSTQVMAQDFVRKHKLTAVATFQNVGIAVIDDEHVRVGEKLDGFRLMRVADRSAILASNGVQVKLTLNPDKLSR